MEEEGYFQLFPSPAALCFEPLLSTWNDNMNCYGVMTPYFIQFISNNLNEYSCKLYLVTKWYTLFLFQYEHSYTLYHKFIRKKHTSLLLTFLDQNVIDRKNYVIDILKARFLKWIQITICCKEIWWGFCTHHRMKPYSLCAFWKETSQCYIMVARSAMCTCWWL